MKKYVRELGASLLVGAVCGFCVGLLVSYFKFTVPQAVILVTVVLVWWAINRKLAAVNIGSRGVGQRRIISQPYPYEVGRGFISKF